MFEVNHEDVFEGNGLIKEGEYEVIVKTGGEDATQGGTVYFSVDLVIRNDVEQQYKNKHIFHAIWKSKEKNEYIPTSFNTMCKAFQIPQGTKFANLEEFGVGIRCKLARVTIKHEEYKGKTYEKVAAWNVTKFPTSNHQFKEKAVQGQAAMPDIKDDDLPF